MRTSLEYSKMQLAPLRRKRVLIASLTCHVHSFAHILPSHVADIPSSVRRQLKVVQRRIFLYLLHESDIYILLAHIIALHDRGSVRNPQVISTAGSALLIANRSVTLVTHIEPVAQLRCFLALSHSLTRFVVYAFALCATDIGDWLAARSIPW